MSYIKSKLHPGERVIFRITQGRKWYHYLMLFITYFILLPILFWGIMTFAVPIISAYLPQLAVMLSVSGFMLLIGLPLLLNFIHFLVDELALTDTRIIGRAQGATTLVFQKIDLPLSGIESAVATANILTIQCKDGKNIIFKNLSESKQFAAKIMELTTQTSQSLD